MNLKFFLNCFLLDVAWLLIKSMIYSIWKKVYNVCPLNTWQWIKIFNQEIIADASVGTPDEVIEKQHLRQDTWNLLQTLHPRERQVLALRYGLEDGSCKSLEEVGRLCHVTKEWIRKIEKEAWSKIRNEETRKKLSHYRQL